MAERPGRPPDCRLMAADGRLIDWLSGAPQRPFDSRGALTGRSISLRGIHQPPPPHPHPRALPPDPTAAINYRRRVKGNICLIPAPTHPDLFSIPASAASGGFFFSLLCLRCHQIDSFFFFPFNQPMAAEKAASDPGGLAQTARLMEHLFNPFSFK